MLFKNLLPLVLASAASAQSLTDALASQNASLSVLTGLLGTQPDLVKTLGGLSNITILAPSNAALGKFLNTTAGLSAATKPDLVAALLTYHVLNGSYPSTAFSTKAQFIHTLLTNTSYANVTGGQVVEAVLNGTEVDITSGGLAKSVVTKADIKFNGGVIHIIDTVLSIPQSDSATAVAAGLTSLASALTSAGLVDTVNGLKDVTIFAPSNNAFANIGSAIPGLSKDQLTKILTYHVVSGVVGYSTLLTNTSLTTVGGGNVTITIANGSVFVNSAKVILVDVLVNNGVVHVIDNVLNPSATTLTPNPTASTQSGAFGSASATSHASGTTSSGVAPTGPASNSPTSTRQPSSGPASSSAAHSSSFTAGAARAMQTGAVGVGAFFGAAAILGNL